MRIQVDWKAYWERFKEAHGDPVPYDGRLLCADGWLHEARYGGQEYPPPDDPVQLRQLMVTYWKTRRAVLADERNGIEQKLHKMRAVVGTRSQPVGFGYTVPSFEKGRLKLTRQEITTNEFQEMSEELADAVAECDEHLADLGVT